MQQWCIKYKVYLMDLDYKTTLNYCLLISIIIGQMIILSLYKFKVPLSPVVFLKAVLNLLLL